MYALNNPVAHPLINFLLNENLLSLINHLKPSTTSELNVYEISIFYKKNYYNLFRTTEPLP